MVIKRNSKKRYCQQAMLGGNMPIAVVTKASVVRSGKKFKYLVLQKPKEEFPKHLLGDTVEEAETLFKEYSKMLNNFARAYSVNTGLERTDLFGEAIMGLARAKRDFNPERSENFKIFAIYKVKDALNKHVRSFSAPVKIPAYIKRVNRWVDNLEAILKCAMLDPDEVEAVLVGDKAAFLPALLNDDYLKLANMIGDEAERLKMSQKDLVKRARIIPYSYGEGADRVDEVYEDQIHAKIVVDELKRHMNKKELTISNMIMEGRTYREIADVFGYQPSWVSYQLKKMKEKLLKKLGGTRP